LATLFFSFLVVLFAIGWIGCALTIPMAAFRFFSVLFEEDEEQPPQTDYVTPML